MPVSQNGYTANDRSLITRFVIGNGIGVWLRSGPAGEMLCHLANWFDAAIADIDAPVLDDWGYAERPIRGGYELSNHASGTALDINATKWPLGSDPSVYLSAAQIAKVRDRLAIYQGCIRWGGDYTGRKDPMHFEIDKDEATVARVWAQINPEEFEMDEARLREIIADELDKKLDDPRRADKFGNRLLSLITNPKATTGIPYIQRSVDAIKKKLGVL
jgi:hypothetical protein